MPFQNRIEIMAPAGSFESLAAALQGGADSVYFGVGKLNMRSRAAVNFSEEDLPEIVARCHEAGAKAYLTLNIIVYDEELEEVHALCSAARKAGVDAVIASDLAGISFARSIGLEVHMSVQANVCNMASVKFYAQYADVVVLALAGFILNLVFRLEPEWMRAVCIIVAVAWCTRLPFISLIPFCIIQALCCCGYMYIGYLLRTHDLLYESLGKKTIIILVILAFSIMIPGNIEVSQNVWALGMLDYVASAITGFLLLRLCMLLNAERFKSKVTRALRTIGRYSLYILCVHTMEYLAFPWTKVQSLVSGHVVLGIVITFIMRCLIIAAGSELLKRCLERRRRKKK